MYFYKNGVAQNSGTAAFTSIDTSKNWRFSVSHFNSGTGFVNFGATAFAHTPPTGYTGLSELVTTYPSVTVDGGNWVASDGSGGPANQNQSQVWSDDLQSSSGWLYPPTSAFDGIGNEGPPYTYAQVLSLIHI